MKTARFLLACVAASLLAACGTDSITAPVAPATPARPNFDESVGPGEEGGDSVDAYGSGSTDCVLVVVVGLDGSITLQCQVNASSQFGSGS